MKSKSGIFVLMLLAIVSMVFMGTVIAEPTKASGGHHGMKDPGYKGGHGGKAMRHGSGMHSAGSHIFSTPWKDSLTKEQALQIDKMHLKLHKKTTVIKAKIEVAKLEMAILLLEDSPSQNKIDKKVKQISEFKQQKMHLHNSHVIEMRKSLTKEQRVTFDSKVLSMAKKGHKKH